MRRRVSLAHGLVALAALAVLGGALGCAGEGGGAGLDVAESPQDGVIGGMDDAGEPSEAGADDVSYAGDPAPQQDEGGVGADSEDRAGPDATALDAAALDAAALDAAALDAAGDSGAPVQDAGADSGTVDADAVDAAGASTPTDPPTAGGKVKVTLGGATADGTGWLDWSAKLPTVTAIFGPQGSHHVWTSFCVPEAVGATVKVRLTLTLQDSKAKVYPGLTALTTGLKPLAGHPGQRCRLAVPGFVKCACTLAGQVLRLRMGVLKGAALQGWAERSVQLVVPANSPCPSKGKQPCTLQLATP